MGWKNRYEVHCFVCQMVRRFREEKLVIKVEEGKGVQVM
jgi:hypothetical protein